MNPLLQNFMERPTSQKVAFWVGSILLLSFLFWQYFYSPQLSEQEKLASKIEDLQSKIGHERRLAANLSKFRKEVEELDVKLKFALQELPDEREIPDLLANISTLARDAGLEVNLFKPSPEVFREFYAEVPVKVAVTGSFHQVATFFDEVGRLPRIVNINQVSMVEPKIGEDRITIASECVATTFRYLDEAERIKAPGESDSKKRRRK
ncbi:MAG: type 4a pilus biogenesis protein PilO [Oligoflexia bacterium]|nr:type 4a pilus biogenesis protein PilO [Oligoflexia bacterium]